MRPSTYINSFKLQRDNNKLLNLIEKLLSNILNATDPTEPTYSYTRQEVSSKLNALRDQTHQYIDDNLDVNEIIPKLNLIQISSLTDIANGSNTTILSPLKLEQYKATETFKGLAQFANATDIYNTNLNTKAISQRIYNTFLATGTNYGLVKFTTNDDLINCVELLS